MNIKGTLFSVLPKKFCFVFIFITQEHSSINVYPTVVCLDTREKGLVRGILNIRSTKGLICDSHWNLGKLLKHSGQEFVSIIHSLTIVDRKVIKSTGGLNYFLSVIDHCAERTMTVIHLYFFSIWQKENLNRWILLFAHHLWKWQSRGHSVNELFDWQYHCSLLRLWKQVPKSCLERRV